MTTTSADPVAIDTELAGIYREVAELETRIATAALSCHYAIGDRKVRAGRSTVWATSDTEAVAEARQRHEAGTLDLSYRASMGRTLDELDTAAGKVVELEARADELEAIHAAHGWARFFLVTDGHIHSSTACHSCNPRTRFGWLPTLSGLTEADAVAAHGALLCTFCYPSAPVEWTNGRELEAAAKDADKCTGRRDYDAPSRTGFYTGNWATCNTCGERVTVTSAGNLRKHKAPAK